MQRKKSSFQCLSETFQNLFMHLFKSNTPTWSGTKHTKTERSSNAHNPDDIANTKLQMGKLKVNERLRDRHFNAGFVRRIYKTKESSLWDQTHRAVLRVKKKKKKKVSYKPRRETLDWGTSLSRPPERPIAWRDTTVGGLAADTQTRSGWIGGGSLHTSSWQCWCTTEQVLPSGKKSKKNMRLYANSLWYVWYLHYIDVAMWLFSDLFNDTTSEEFISSSH